MSSITNFENLIKSMQPILHPEEYVFYTSSNGKYGDHEELSPICAFQEKEGLSLILLKNSADKSGFQYANTFKMITLSVHSSLAAVGLTAAVSTCLSENGISSNIVAAYYHDHIFVQTEKAESALSVLHHLSQNRQQD